MLKRISGSIPPMPPPMPPPPNMSFGVLVRVELDSHLAVCLFDLVTCGRFLDAHNLIIVLSLGFLELQLCLADLSRNVTVLWFKLLDRLPLLNSIFPPLSTTQSIGLGLAGLCVTRVKADSLLTVGNGIIVLLELDLALCSVLQQLRVHALVGGVDVQSAGVFLDSWLQTASLEIGVPLFLHAIKSLDNPEPLDGIAEIGITVDGHTEALNSLFVLALVVKNTSAEDKSLRILVVVSEKVHSNVLRLS
ncbi:hypothetical protein HG530_003591 [Fusarium avenaceum]|nr:hypothetical protein HG530_003591 [Fusarium avenaceum]